MSDLVQELRDRAYSFKSPDPLLEKAANEIERLQEALDSLGDNNEVAWRGRDGNAEFMPVAAWIGRAAAEIERLRGVIDTYALVSAASAREIALLRGNPPPACSDEQQN